MYGQADNIVDVRLTLHVNELGITHPFTSEALHFEIPDPEELITLL
jgi:23S rRNA-/tRNA-specific pseudouridylate synthase